MKRQLLDILRCPFCGGRLEVSHGVNAPKAAVQDETSVTHGTLFCMCCAFPVVDGIPCIRDGDSAAEAMEMLATGCADEARDLLMGLNDDGAGPRRKAFHALLEKPDELTFRSALKILCTDSEGDYFLHRFSDPYFATSDGLIRAVAAPNSPLPSGSAIDLCGGAGHLSRSMLRTGKFEQVVLADLAYWKVWLGKRFIAPDAQTIVCDADRALPFARDAFSFALCSGAFEYIWSRRSFGEEIQRLIGQRGLALITHVRNLLCHTFNPGMPLAPAGYRNIFGHFPTRIMSECEVLDAIVSGRPVDLRGRDDGELQDAALLIIATSQNEALLDCYDVPGEQPTGRFALNPLYTRDPDTNDGTFRLSFPTPEYEDEFGECRQYLPPTVTFTAQQRSLLSDGAVARSLASLVKSRVLLPLPEKYL